MNTLCNSVEQPGHHAVRLLLPPQDGLVAAGHDLIAQAEFIPLLTEEPFVLMATALLTLGLGTAGPLQTIVALALVLLALWISSRYKLGSTTRFLFIGMIVGPDAFGLLSNPGVVHTFTELGALLLFFLLGAGLHREDLRALHRLGIATTLEMAVMAGSAALLLMLYGVGWQLSLLTGSALAAGSAALLYVWPKDHRSGAHSARVDLKAVVQIQGLVVLLLLLVFPLKGTVEEAALVFFRRVFMFIGLGFVIFLFAQERVPAWLRKIEQTQGRQGYHVAALALCLLVVLSAWPGGLSLGVGFFLAGLLLSESRFRGRFIGELRGLHLLFGAFFFVPLGMLFDPRFVVAYAPLVLLGAGGVLLLKGGILAGSMLVRGRSPQAAFKNAWLLAPVGEFAFVLFYMAVEGDFLAKEAPAVKSFVAISVLLLIAVPVLRRWFIQSRLRSKGSATRNEHPATRAVIRLDTLETSPVVKRRSSAAKRGCKTRRRLKTIEVMAGSPAAAQSLEELDLLRRFGVFVVAAWRGDLYFSTLPPDFQPESRDRLVLSGHEEELTDCEALFQGPPTACF